ncbi:hypothetical protein OG379_20810 [Streptomyces sp. NBC_01166]|uniref:histone protein n=1 Tax=Streptomyces sp. NBC_01166 TaxID=2903755 RepID=UPI0038700F00|nr:hypothetical protein OG379_20810 [Streptomyces sp. NBC_01166]
MDTTTRAALAAALAAGYVIGRTKQGKLALGLLAVASGKSLDPKALIGEGVKKLSENPQFAQLGEQVRGELLASGREALSEVTNRGVASLGEALQQRMLSLTGAPEDEEEGLEEEEPEYEDEDVEDEDEDVEAEEPEPARPSRRRPAKSTKAEKPTDRKPGPKNPPAKRAMARKAAERKPGPKNPPARKAMERKAAQGESAGKRSSAGRAGGRRPARGTR